MFLSYLKITRLKITRILVILLPLLLLGLSSQSLADDGTCNLQTGFPEHPFKTITPYLGGKVCGAGWKAMIIPDSFYYSTGYFSFAKACAKHDRCYTNQRGQALCDRQFHKDIQNRCKIHIPKSKPIMRKKCLGYADYYHQMVVKFGAKHYAKCK